MDKVTLNPVRRSLTLDGRYRRRSLFRLIWWSSSHQKALADLLFGWTANRDCRRGRALASRMAALSSIDAQHQGVSLLRLALRAPDPDHIRRPTAGGSYSYGSRGAGVCWTALATNSGTPSAPTPWNVPVTMNQASRAGAAPVAPEIRATAETASAAQQAI